MAVDIYEKLPGRLASVPKQVGDDQEVVIGEGSRRSTGWFIESPNAVSTSSNLATPEGIYVAIHSTLTSGSNCDLSHSRHIVAVGSMMQPRDFAGIS